MSIRVLTKRISKNGTAETSELVFEQPSIVFGRGPQCDVVLEGSDISLTHARVSAGANGFIVEDLNSLGGVRVSGTLVKIHTLQSGEELRIGSRAYKVRAGTEALELSCEIREEVQPSTEVLIAEQTKAFDPRQSFFSFRRISVALIAVFVLLYALYPITTGDKRSWSTGPVTQHHKTIEAQCSACHNGDFTKVPDSKCESCHELSIHAAMFAKNSSAHAQALNAPCASCHLEHKGEAALLPHDSALCISCHGDLKQVLPESSIEAVKSWSTHPEFSVRPWVDEEGLRRGVLPKGTRLDDKANLSDTTKIRLNHALHLKKDLRGVNGAVTLQCKDCHALSDDFRGIRPVSMEANCKSCHALGFDEALPNVEVPHASPDIVYKFLYAEYAKMLLDPNSANDRSVAGRQRPGVEVKTEVVPAFARAEVEKRARDAERELFTRTACKLCHEISPAESGANDASRYEVVTPHIPTQWMPAAVFSHGAHEYVNCESCHANARESKGTADVLLPSIADCRTCHAGHSSGGMVKSDCTTCHSFHASLALPAEKKRSVETITGKLKNG